MRTIFPQDAARRAFLKSVGASTALAALSQFFPLKTATEVFAQGGPLEKKDLKVGFIPITCAHADHHGASRWASISRHGLNVEVIKTAGWAVIRDKTLNKEYDAAHMLSPMPLAITLGVGSNADPLHGAGDREHQRPGDHARRSSTRTSAIRSQWKGFKFAVPFDYSMHNYLLRYYLAEHGLDPDQDVQIRAVPPPEMVANLRADNHRRLPRPRSDEPARGLSTASASSTCCRRRSGTAIPAARSRPRGSSSPRRPNTYAALLKAIIDATAFATKAENRKQIAEAIAPANYLNQPVTVLEQILTGTFADGLGNVQKVPNRVDFDPFPWESFAVWILTQMKRWGQIKGDVDYAGVAKQVFLATDTTQADEGGRPDAADRDHEDLRRSWARPSIRPSRRNTSRASRSSRIDVDDAARAGRHDHHSRDIASSLTFDLGRAPGAGEGSAP